MHDLLSSSKRGFSSTHLIRWSYTCIESISRVHIGTRGGCRSTLRRIFKILPCAPAELTLWIKICQSFEERDCALFNRKGDARGERTNRKSDQRIKCSEYKGENLHMFSMKPGIHKRRYQVLFSRCRLSELSTAQTTPPPPSIPATCRTDDEFPFASKKPAFILFF